MRKKMRARPCEAVGRQSAAREADHVAEVVAPARRPQRGIHAALGDVVAFRCALDVAQHARDALARQSQRCADLDRVRIGVQRRRIRCDLDREARIMMATAALIAGAAIGGVVGRRAEMQECKAVSVMMGVE